MNSLTVDGMTNDGLVLSVTAFHSYADLTAAMDRGYVPTLTTVRSRLRYQQQRNAMVSELADRLEADGYRVIR